MPRLLLLALLLAAGCSRTATTGTQQVAAGGTPQAVARVVTAQPPAAVPAQSPAADPARQFDLERRRLVDALRSQGVLYMPGERVEISGAALTPEGNFRPAAAALIPKVASAKIVFVYGAPVFGEGAGRLVARIPDLTIIEFSLVAATEAGVSALGDSPTLAAIKLNRWAYQKPEADYKTLAGLAKLKSLTAFYGQYCGATSAAVGSLTGNAKLRFLDLSNTAIDDGVGSYLAKFPALETLQLSSNKQITGAAIAPLKATAGLRHLDLTYTCVGDAGLEALASHPHLTTLKLTGTKVTGAGLAFLKANTKLGWLEVAYTDVGDEGLKAIAHATQLTDLDLVGTKVTGAGLKALSPLTHLKNLRLRGTNVSDAGVQALAAVPSLTHLDLSGTDLSSTKVTDAGIAALVAALPNLEELSAMQLGLTDVSLVALAKAPKLKSLSLRDNKFTEAGLAKFKADRPKVSLSK